MKPISMVTGLTVLILLAETDFLNDGDRPSFSWIKLTFLFTTFDILIFLIAAVFVVQAFNPSPHVWTNLMSPGRPHLPCQDPPLPQQVGPDLLGTHLTQSGNQIVFITKIISAGLIISAHFHRTVFLFLDYESNGSLISQTGWSGEADTYHRKWKLESSIHLQEP